MQEVWPTFWNWIMGLRSHNWRTLLALRSSNPYQDYAVGLVVRIMFLSTMRGMVILMKLLMKGTGYPQTQIERIRVTGSQPTEWLVKFGPCKPSM